jgi:xylulokinase
MKYLLGIDLGTTAIKVAVFDQAGEKLGDSTQEYKLITPSPLIVEQEVGVYWSAFKAGLAESLKEAGISGEEIAALSISAQGETLILTDKNGEPLRNAIVWMDNRAQEESLLLEKQFTNAVIHKTTGQVSMLAMWPAAKILWLKVNEPNIYERADKFLLIEDYFFYRMSGKFYGEGSLWCSTIMWDINEKRYWPEMLAGLGVREDQLPQIVESGTALGRILPEVALELGLSKDVELVMGALDQACGAIGVGNVRKGIFSESTGAALAVCAVTDHPVFDPNAEMPCFYFGIPNMYMIHAFSTGGIVFKWLRDNFCSEEEALASRSGIDAYAFMDMEAKTIPAGSDGLVILPHFQGAGPPDSDQNSKGVIY